MRKVFIIILFVPMFTACNRKWNAKDRKQFVSKCIEKSKAALGEATATSYCECMQPLIEEKYPTMRDADNVKKKDMETPEMMAKVRNCLKMDENSEDFNKSTEKENTWSDKDRNDFLTTCENGATGESGLTKDKAKSYCECMFQKVQAKYPNMKDARKFNVSESVEMAKGCLK